jgi:ABC-type lipoprotein release transport system permease subunit
MATRGAPAVLADTSGSPTAAGWLARRQVRGGWGLLLAVSLAMLVAVTLLSAVPLYSRLLANLQLQGILNGEPPNGRNVEIVLTSGQPSFAGPVTIAPTFFRSADDAVRALGTRYLSGITVRSVNHSYVSDALDLTAVGDRQLNPNVLAAPQITFQAYDYAQTRDHMRLVAGAFPVESSPAADGLPQALITTQMADQEGAQVGDLVVGRQLIYPHSIVSARITGIWAPPDPPDAFWNNHDFISRPRKDSDPFVYPVLLTQPDFVATIGPLSNVRVSQSWVFYTDPKKITMRNMAATAQRLAVLRAHLVTDLNALGLGGVVVLTNLDVALQQVTDQLALLGLPLYVVVAQVVGLALLAVLVMASLLAESQATTLVTLKTRGASGGQLLGSYLAQAVALGALGALAGPWLGARLALLLTQWFVPGATFDAAGVTMPYLAGTVNPADAAVPALVGGALGGVALLAAIQGVARLDVLAERRERARASRQPLWRRAYLDVALAVICGLGFLDLNQFGGVGVRERLGERASTPLIAAAPSLLLLAGALLALRLFPAMVERGARLAARRRGAAAMLAFSDLARSPAGPLRLLLLLLVTVGLALFALAANATLAQSAVDLAAFTTGADLRMVQLEPEHADAQATITARLRQTAGVAGVTPVYRGFASTSGALDTNNVDLLGIDATSWGQVAGSTSWRADYADTSLRTLLSDLRAHQIGADDADRAGATGAGTSQYPIWAIVSDGFAARQHLHVGDRFPLLMPDSFGLLSSLRVGAIVHDFPTLAPSRAVGGFVVLNLNDCLGAVAVETSGATYQVGPNEFWMRLAPGARHAAVVRALDDIQGELDEVRISDRQALEALFGSVPAQVGMRSLLTVGALMAVTLAVLGATLHAVLTARRRTLEFAILRALGMSRGQLARLMLARLAIIYALGLAGGTALGLLLATTATSIFQQNGIGVVGGPPTSLVFPAPAIAAFYGALLAACVLSLAIEARAALRLALSQTLRLGED